MSKTRDTGYLANVIQVHDTGVRIMSGSEMLMAISSSGAVTITGELSGSDAANSLLLNGTGSVGFTTTASFLVVSASQQQISSSLLQVSASYISLSASYTTFSGSASTRISNNETASNNLTNASASFSTRTTQVEKTYATTGSNTYTGTQNFSSTCTPNGFNSGASIYTAGGLQVTNDAYFSSSVFIKGNVTVYGTQSVAYISSSQLNIGTNTITVNTFTPSVRFGGLSVFDSGSTGLTGSIFWDSELNRWIYVNASGSGGGATYGGGMFISGPRNTQGMGCEQGTTACMLMVGQGGDHMTSSLVYHDSTVTCIGSNASITSTGAACFASSVTTGGTITLNNASTNYATLNLNGAAGYGAELKFGEATGGYLAAIRHNYNVGTGLEFYTCGLGAGSLRMYIAPTGNVGIGTSSPSTISTYKILEITGPNTSTGGMIRTNICDNSIVGKFYSNNTGVWISSETSHPLILETANTERMRITSCGNVGVNTTNPLSRFDVALQGCESFTIGNCSNTITCGDLIGALTFVSRDGSTNSTGGIAGIRSYATQTYNTGGVEGDLRFYTSIINTQPNGTILSGNEVLRLSQDGIACFACRVCVPSLSVSNTNAVLTIQGTATSGEAQLDLSGKNSSGTSRGAVFKYDNSDIIRIGTSSPIGMRFETCDVTRLTITSAGNVGIGTCCPTHQLHVVNSVKFDTGLYFNNGAANGAFVWQIANESLRFGTCDTERMRITNGGNVLIGTQSASNSTLQIVCVPSSYYGMIETVGCSAGSVKHFRVHKPGYVEYGVGVLDTNAFHISTASTFPTSNGFTMLSGGNIGFGETAPGTDKMVILGGTANSNIFLRLKTDGSHGIKPQIHFDSGLVGTNRSSKAIIMGGYNSPTGGSGGVMQFYTNDTSENSQQRMCIDPAGQVTIMGALAKGSGSFRICHPLSSKVKTHALVHSFIEGPNADLIYSGHTKLIGGVSCINIDCISRMTEGTFEALNRCVRIFTTNESSWSAVRGRVCRNIVLIESQDTTSEDEISWMVIGERHDQHMFDTEWTDSDARVITEPELVIVNDEDITE